MSFLSPLFRLFLSYSVRKFLLGGFVDSWQILDLIKSVSSFESSGESTNEVEVPVEQNAQSSDSSPESTTLEGVRAQNSELENEQRARIRNLESKLAYRLPPQLNPGEYERLVRENLDNAIYILHYQEALNQE